MYFKLQVIYKLYRQVLTSSKQLSAPFKAGNSQQVQTCYKPMEQRQRKTATFSSFLWYGRNGSFNNIEPLRVNATMLAALHPQAFSLGDTKLLHFVSTE
jgi:hypothetical protein